ncbi:MAG: hypothetical protein GY793_04185 [Proteobacteria bacterium]|nr:hypothetical protein [Pseudomonadota bacterium]
MLNKSQDIKSKISYSAFYCKELGAIRGIPTGNDWHKMQGLCPFHSDKFPGSFHINMKTGSYHCFSCGSSGDVFDFVKEKYNLDFKQALEKLEKEVC